jgi:hypothetical protein
VAERGEAAILAVWRRGTVGRGHARKLIDTGQHIVEEGGLCRPSTLKLKPQTAAFGSDVVTGIQQVDARRRQVVHVIARFGLHHADEAHREQAGACQQHHRQGHLQGEKGSTHQLRARGRSRDAGMPVECLERVGPRRPQRR